MVRFFPEKEGKQAVPREVGGQSGGERGSEENQQEGTIGGEVQGKTEGEGTSDINTAGVSVACGAGAPINFEEMLHEIYESLPPEEKEDTPENLEMLNQLQQDVQEGRLDLEMVFQQFADSMAPSMGFQPCNTNDSANQRKRKKLDIPDEPQPGPSGMGHRAANPTQFIKDEPINNQKGQGTSAGVAGLEQQVSQTIEHVKMDTGGELEQQGAAAGVSSFQPAERECHERSAAEWYALMEKQMGSKMPDLLYDQYVDRVRKLVEIDAYGKTRQISREIELLDLIELLKAVETALD